MTFYFPSPPPTSHRWHYYIARDDDVGGAWKMRLCCAGSRIALMRRQEGRGHPPRPLTSDECLHSDAWL